MYKDITGAILAGGKNSRFDGIIKSKLHVHGVPVISRIIDVFKGLFDDIIIVTNDPGEYLQFDGCRIERDIFMNIGPLGGIHAALKASSGKSVFVTAGDMPFPDRSIIVRLIKNFLGKNAEVTVPLLNGRLETLHAVYNASLLNKIEQYIKESPGHSLRNLIRGLNTDIVTLENCSENLTAMTNLNSPYDLKLLNTWRSE
jgi:molybdopterin-guanine dinucleotide biosynthesis protein A